MAQSAIMVKHKKMVEDEHLRVFASFSHLNSGVLNKIVTKWYPPTDVYNTDDTLIVISEIAGVSSENIKISSEGELLKIEGERPEISSNCRATYHNMEINYGPFERNIHMPKSFVGGEIIANYTEGFLRIEVKKPITSKVIIDVE